MLEFCLSTELGALSTIELILLSYDLLPNSLLDTNNVIKKYSKAKSNLESLDNLGATILHGVDATKMRFHTDLRMRKFDRIIFNFPHAGFYGKEDEGHLIKMHRNLVQGFFKSASHMLRPNGEVHVNHKTTAPYNHWNLEELASRHSLGLIECVDFTREDYPGYNNKRGAGKRCDDPFLLGECSTFKFRFVYNVKKKITQVVTNGGYTQSPFQVLEMHSQPQHHPCLFEISYPRADFITNMHSNTLSHVGSLPNIRITDECCRIFNGYFANAVEMFGRTGYDVVEVIHETLRNGFERYMSEASGRDIHGYLMLLHELHRLSIMRSAWLRRMLLGPS